ncbi:cytochrome c oxidase assembly protein [Devosia sp. PTR5]|uniref:Cytochrome c oxidase assembly protein n=1 Tax=Devosia oryzisoli TaxID=2774138 RepID=A0A927FVI7_9HYPH|nr:cytochrome c oxidase assembly protein [Devosia oryzisoli]MBD8066102.1 cytochrome c oxidase assembly protein [Devosia oryzisoli]
MLQHIVLMNVAVPVLALLVPLRALPKNLWRTWPWATALQVVLLWGWHSPGVLPAALGNTGLMMLMHLSLTACAAWFWLAIFSMPRDRSWRAIFALLITGKLFCLLGALLVFAPNVVFDLAGSGHTHLAEEAGSALGDQQAAGMLMLVACPLTYVGAGIVLASRWFLDLDRNWEANAGR